MGEAVGGVRGDLQYHSIGPMASDGPQVIPLALVFRPFRLRGSGAGRGGHRRRTTFGARISMCPETRGLEADTEWAAIDNRTSGRDGGDPGGFRPLAGRGTSPDEGPRCSASSDRFGVERMVRHH